MKGIYEDTRQDPGYIVSSDYAVKTRLVSENPVKIWSCRKDPVSAVTSRNLLLIIIAELM